jgi:hypothetical protein
LAVKGTGLADGGVDGTVPFPERRILGVVEVLLAKLVANLDEAWNGEDSRQFPPWPPALKEISDT